MKKSLNLHISSLLGVRIESVSTVTGGDISTAYKLETSDGNFFLKLNDSRYAEPMFRAEAQGLNQIGSTKTIATPNIILNGNFEESAFLVLEFIDTKSPSKSEMAIFGKQLAALHTATSDFFGNEFHNFIGSLVQSNKKHQNWIDFYCDERLWPQIKIANSRNLLSKNQIPSIEKIKISLENLLGNIKPSLLHGDLWSGNYLISKTGQPYLIDPAIYYGDAEVDIAMSQLFGGFGDDFYEAYLEASPISKFSKDKIEIYQLYYLLVHLNLFGRSYHDSVVSILRKHF